MRGLPGLYDVLGLAPGARDDEIRNAITEQRRLWRRRTTSPDIAVRQEAERRMQQFTEAEQILLDPSRRPTYDAQIFGSAPPQAPPNVSKDERWLVRALEQLDQQQYEVASFTARRAVEADPENSYAWSVLAEALASAGELMPAVDAIERALRLRPEDARLHAVRGSVFIKLNDLDRAVSAFRAASRLDPREPQYAVRAIEAMIDSRQLDQAMAEAESLYHAHPDDGEVRTVLAQSLLERAIAAQDELPDGRLLITSPGQASYVESLCDRGLSVQAPDVEVNADLQRHRDYARKARRPRFSMVSLQANYKWPVGLALFSVAGMCCVPNVLSSGVSSFQLAYVAAVVVLVAATVGVIARTCFEPQYRRNLAVIEHIVPRRKGRGPAEPDTTR